MNHVLNNWTNGRGLMRRFLSRRVSICYTLAAYYVTPDLDSSGLTRQLGCVQNCGW
jgi:hypothetical protein